MQRRSASGGGGAWELLLRSVIIVVRQSVERVNGLQDIPRKDSNHLAICHESVVMAFSELKMLLRDGAERTTDKLWTLCGRVLDLFTPTECGNYFRHCGYRYT